MKRILLPLLIFSVFLFSCTPDIPDPVEPNEGEKAVADAVMALFENYIGTLKPNESINGQNVSLSCDTSGPVRDITHTNTPNVKITKGNIDYEASVNGVLNSTGSDYSEINNYESADFHLSVDFFFHVEVDSAKHTVALIGKSSFDKEAISSNTYINPLDYIFKIDGNRIKFDAYIDTIFPYMDN